jgi:hypothetical protein
MMQRQTGVTEKQPGTRVPHNLSDFQFHVWFIAVDAAFAASGFLVLKRAFTQTHERVFFELLAFGA